MMKHSENKNEIQDNFSGIDIPMNCLFGSRAQSYSFPRFDVKVSSFSKSPRFNEGEKGI
jgi:hypothetical protein